MSGWGRVFLVVTVAWGLCCLWMGGLKYEEDRRDTAAAIRFFGSGANKAGSVTPGFRGGQSEGLREHQAGNMQRQVIRYGLLWMAGALSMACFIWVVRWVAKGFASGKKV